MSFLGPGVPPHGDRERLLVPSDRPFSRSDTGVILHGDPEDLETVYTDMDNQDEDIVTALPGQVHVDRHRSSSMLSPVKRGSIMEDAISYVRDRTESLTRMDKEQQAKHIEAGANVLETYHDSFLFGKVPLTVRVRTALRGGKIGYAWHLFEFTLAVFSGFLYVYSTYKGETEAKWVVITQNFASIAFVFDYFLRVYSEPVRWYYIMSIRGLVDLMSAVPVVFLFRDSKRHGGSVLRLLQFLRIMRIFSLLAKLGMVGSSVTQQIMLLVISTFGAVFLDSGVLQWVETYLAPEHVREKCPISGCMSFWDAFYFLIVTIATVGYGDVIPHTMLGQLIALVTILVALVVIPIQVAQITMLASRRPYGGALRAWKIMECRFLIISGSISFNAVQEFLAEVYNASHGEDLEAYPLRVVILAPFSPSFELKQIVSLYHGQVEFIEGSPVNQSDMDRVCARKASAIILLADQEPDDIQVEDAAQIVRALAVHRFCRGDVQIIVEVLNPETQTSAVWDDSQCSGIEVICPAKIHYKMMAHSCFIKGLYTFITNVFTSELKLTKLSTAHFLSEYFHGFDNEVYPMILPPTFHNLLFEEVAEFIVTAFNVILFALDVPAISAETGAQVRRVLLHPKGHVIHPDDVGLVISWDLHTACIISKFDDRELPSGWFKQALRDRKSRDKALAYAEGRKILETVRNGWKSRGSIAGLTREVWMSQNASKKQASERLVARSANGHQQLTSRLQSTIYRALHQKSIDDQESSSETKTLDRSGLHDADRWGKAFSSGDMNDMDGQFPVGLSLAKATEELLSRRLAFQLLLLPQRDTPTRVPNPPVVILTPDLPNSYQWGSVGIFDDVFVLQGSPIYELDLMRGGVLHAEKIVVLADQGLAMDLTGAKTGDDAKLNRKVPAAYTSDVDNIIITANIERLLGEKSPDLTVEMQHTLGFYYIRPQYQIPRKMVPDKDYRRNRDALVHFSPPYMEGKAVSSSMLGFLMRSSFYNRNTVSIVEQLVEGGFVEDGDGISSARRRILEQISVPAQYVNGAYADLFVGVLLDHGMLALGLYRASGTLGSPTAYVYTNPPKHTVVHENDLVFVLI